MSKQIKLATLLMLFFAAGLLQSFEVANHTDTLKIERPDAIIIQYDVDMEAHDMSWTAITGNTPYQVTIYNMTAGTLHTQFYTSTNAAQISGLVNGSRYGISVTRGSQTDFIIIDIIDIG